MRRTHFSGTLILATALAAACTGAGGDADAGAGTVEADSAAASAAASAIQCDPDNGGLTLPQGFCAVVVADDVGPARHLVVARNGDVFVALGGAPGGVVALRDTTGDGRADVQEHFGADPGTGIALRDGYLYFAPDTGVVRYRLPAGRLRPDSAPVTLVSGLPARPGHSAKSIALRGNELFVNIGSPSNSCQVDDRQNGSPGRDPCPELATRAGIWRFDAARPGQTEADGTRFATGIRNAVGLAVGPDGELYATQHGRDQLFQNWGKYYTAQQGAELPAEELLHVRQGDDFGWPYCYYDQNQKKLVLAPEYGGDGGKAVGRCAQKKAPIAAFPGHWAPDGLLFYEGRQFPARFRGGAFIAFHGSWNRAPEPQQGYKVVFVPMQDGQPSGAYEDFADGFAGAEKDPRQAAHRPVGLAVGPDGSLYVGDDKGGRIWRVVYHGAGG